jgi:hypothetical protein
VTFVNGANDVELNGVSNLYMEEAYSFCLAA